MEQDIPAPPRSRWLSHLKINFEISGNYINNELVPSSEGQVSDSSETGVGKSARIYLLTYMRDRVSTHKHHRKRCHPGFSPGSLKVKRLPIA